MGTKVYDNALDLITFSRNSGGTSLRKISYGSELVTNGTFDTDVSGWNSYSGGILTFEAGELKLTGNPGDITYGATQNLSTVIGKVYSISISVRTDGTAYLRVGVTSAGSFTLVNENTSSATSTTITAVFTATATTTIITLQGSTDATSYFDNVSVKEVLFDQPAGTLQLFYHPADIPRIDYSPDGTAKGLLIEEQRTNLLEYSQGAFSTNWSNQNVTVTDNNFTAPDGTETATLVVPDGTSSNLHRVYRTFSAVNGTGSFFAKAAGYNYLRLLGGGAGPIFNLSNGTLESGSGEIQSVGNGWYKCSAYDSALNSWQALVFDNAAGSAYSGDGTSGIYIWGAQLEAGAFPTSYIPTSGSTVTRAADVASIPVSAFGFNTGAGTFVAEFDFVDGAPPNGNNNYLLSGTADARVMYNNAANTLWQSYDGVGAVTFGAVDADGSSQRLAVGVKTGKEIATAKNGSITGSVTSFTNLLNELVAADIVIGGSAFQKLNGHIKSIQYFPRRLTNAQLQELTQ